MKLRENIFVAVESLRSNILRSVLTVLIIAFGILSLVGIITAIEGMQSSIVNSFSSLGANSFDVRTKSFDRRKNRGVSEKQSKPLRYEEALKFRDKFSFSKEMTIHTQVTRSAEVKRLSKKTNPDTQVYGGDNLYLLIKGYSLEEGRNFSTRETQVGSNVAIIGSEIKKGLFKDFESPINKLISVFGVKYKVIGVLKEEGGFGGDKSADKKVILPLENASRVSVNYSLYYTITVAHKNLDKMTYVTGEAIGLMRKIRQDKLGEEDSFEVSENKSLNEQLEETSVKFKMGGVIIALVTLLGASIALMNIMMVSVTERTREIGVRKALGATPNIIMQQFLIEAIIICLIGGLFGVFLGLVTGNLVSVMITDGSFVAPWAWIFISFVVCIFVGLLSGFFPARKASKLDPIESLRYE